MAIEEFVKAALSEEESLKHLINATTSVLNSGGLWKVAQLQNRGSAKLQELLQRPYEHQGSFPGISTQEARALHNMCSILADTLVDYSKAKAAEAEATNAGKVQRSPIVLAKFTGAAVDANKDEPVLPLDPRYLYRAQVQEPASASSADAVLDQIITKLEDGTSSHQDKKQKVSEIPKDPLLDHFEQDSYKLLESPVSEEYMFRRDWGGQLQMHLGGTRLILQPLLVAKTMHSKQGITLTLKSDQEWSNYGVFTEVGSAEEGRGRRRLKAKLKPDAMLELAVNGVFQLPLFHFEQKSSETNFESALNKAILLAQLAWRRMHIAVESLWLDGTKKKELQHDVEHTTFWFAALAGSNFMLGGLRGKFGDKKSVSINDSRAIETAASFRVVTTANIDVHRRGKFAAELMYELCKHKEYFIPDAKILKALQSLAYTFWKQQENWQEAGTINRSSRNKNKDPGKATGKPKSGGQNNQSSAENPIGIAKKSAFSALLKNIVKNLEFCCPAIPLEALQSETPFDGDHLFEGIWIGQQTMQTQIPSLLHPTVLEDNGTRSNSKCNNVRVFVKAFVGKTELSFYDNECRILKACRGIPYVQQPVLFVREGNLGAILTSYVSKTLGGYDVLLNRHDDVLLMCRQMLKVLVALHRRGIIHRDIKPSNILWSSEKKEATLIDFGLAVKVETTKQSEKSAAVVLRSVRNTRNKSNNVPHRNEDVAVNKNSKGDKWPKLVTVEYSGEVGTPGFMAPELVDKRPTYSEKVDVFSLGVTIGKVATKDGVDKNADLSKAVKMMLKKDPNERVSAEGALILLDGVNCRQ